MKGLAAAMILLSGAGVLAQTAPDGLQPVATTKQLMLDLIHPASNDILLAVFGGAPQSEQQWAAVRRSAVALAESANLLMMRGRARDQGDWMKDARALGEIGTAAYKAAQAKDVKALASLAEPLDASCTTCHKHYRPNVFPVPGASR
jgi:hypothetical protein